jgi:iron complex outermembrane receptor protein
MSKTLKKSLFIAVLLLLNGLSHAQTVTGKVTDSSGSVPGVNVQVQNSNIKTETDVNGKYTLSNLPKNAVLNFSYLGFAPTYILEKIRHHSL